MLSVWVEVWVLGVSTEFEGVRVSRVRVNVGVVDNDW